MCTAPGETRSRLCSELSRKGFEVHVASGQLDAQAHLARASLGFDLVVVDAALTALPAVEALTRQAKPPKVIIVAPVARELANRDATRLHAAVVDHSASSRDIAAVAANQVSPTLPR